MSIDISVKEVSRAASVSAQDAHAKRNSSERALKVKDESDRKEERPPADIDEIASEVQLKLKRLNTELRFEVDGKSSEVTIKIIDPESGKLIRQIPSEKLIAIRDRMDEIIGVLYNAES